MVNLSERQQEILYELKNINTQFEQKEISGEEYNKMAKAILAELEKTAKLVEGVTLNIPLLAEEAKEEYFRQLRGIAELNCKTPESAYNFLSQMVDKKPYKVLFHQIEQGKIPDDEIVDISVSMMAQDSFLFESIIGDFAMQVGLDEANKAKLLIELQKIFPEKGLKASGHLVTNDNIAPPLEVYMKLDEPNKALEIIETEYSDYECEEIWQRGKEIVAFLTKRRKQ